MSSFDILSKTTPLQTRLFLEASAGTGKTFAIEHLFVRLLLETSFSIDQIAVLTFTRAATRELKERIRSNLEAIYQKKSSFSYLEEITDLQKAKIEDALKNFESAQIFTIHGFCSHLLKQFALEAHVGLHLSEWSCEEEAWEIKEFLRKQTAVSAGQIRRLLGKFQFEIDRFEKALLNSKETDLAIPSSEELLHEIQSLLPPPFPVLAEFENIRSSYKGMTSDELTPQAKELEEVLIKKDLPQKIWEKWISTPSFFLKNFTPSQLKVRAKPVSSEKLSHLRDLILPRLEIAQNSQQIFLKLSSAWHCHRKIVSKQNEKITPDDLLKLVHSKLLEPHFLKAIRKKYHALIVDEFQDTDPLQWNIFKTVFLEDSSKSIYLVGDPKQSIYAFREADIYTFLDAAKQFGFDQKASLLRNFRSSSDLLSQLNTLFCNTPWMDLPKQNDFLHIPIALSAYEGEGKLCFMIAEGEKGRSSRFPSIEMEEEQFFPFIVEEIQQKNLDPSHIAILVKDRYQANRLKTFLDRWEIPAILHRTSSLSDSAVIEFLEEMADACLQLSSPAIKKMLLGPFARTAPDELTPQLVFQTKEALLQLKNCWIDEGFAIFFARFLNTVFWKESALMAFYRFQKQTLYDDLLEITQKVLSASHPYQLKQALAALKKYETEDRISSHPQGVQIMTIYASKGLEFETVFALGLSSRTPSQELSEEYLKELDAEKMRQLYVALTRAEKRLYIPIARELPAPAFSLGEGSPIELFLTKATPDLSSYTQEILSHRTFHLQSRQKSAAPLLPPSPFQLPFPPQFMHSFSSLAQERITPAKGDDQGIESGAETGLIVHRILERYFNQEGSLETLLLQETKRTRLASKTESLLKMLQDALCLPLDHFCLGEISLHSIQTEMEFLYTTSQGWMKGYIDLCFEHENRLYAIDWKTNLLENTDPKTIEHLMKSHDYLLQGKIYTEALQKYLSRFPSHSLGGVYFVFIRGPVVYRYTSYLASI